MNPKEIILEFFRMNPEKTFNAKQVHSKTLLKDQSTATQVYEWMLELREEEQLENYDYGKFRLVIAGKHIQVTLTEVSNDAARAKSEEVPQEILVYFEPGKLYVIGDVCEVKIIARRAGYLETELVQVIEYAKRTFVGNLLFDNGKMIFRPDDRKASWYITVDKKELNGAKTGEKVQIELLADKKGNPYATVTQVIGKLGLHQTEMHAIIMEFGFETGFPEDAIQESEKFPSSISPEEAKKRRDFRGITTFTIDPLDAKDFDDALSYKVLENGNVEIGVHIADVSHFVRPGTALDREAQKRATSVYLVDRTLPMLPERISNNLCSLRPHEDRLAFSAVFEINDKGNVVNEWFGKTIIHSDRRFTYEEAQMVLDTSEGDFVQELLHLNKIAYQLRKARFKNGSINFESDEIKFVLDEKGKPIQVIPKIRKDAHKLIEDFMLLANKQVAKYLSKVKKTASVYRVHDLPNEDKIRDLSFFVKTLGYDVDDSSQDKLRASLNKMMQQAEGKPEMDVISSIAIRSMAKAIYSTANIGHYGLGFKHYTHFTSPIRRYPDLLVHRLLEHHLETDTKKPLYASEVLAQLCKHSSNQEKKAADAERASVKYKQIEFLEDKIGQVYEGIISGITGWGVYVEILATKTEGLIKIGSISDDHYVHDERHFRLIGKRTKHVLQLGDKVSIQVSAIDLQKRTADFELITAERFHYQAGTEMKNNRRERYQSKEKGRKKDKKRNDNRKKRK